MIIRQRVNFKAGTVTSLATSSPGTTTTITGNNFPTPPSGYYVPITLNPGYFGATNSSGPEIAYITSGGTSTVANVTRVLESSVVATGTNVPWVAGPLVSDFDVSNLTSSGALTVNNGLTLPNNGESISFTGSYGTISGAQSYIGQYGTFSSSVVVGGNLTVSGRVTSPNGVIAPLYVDSTSIPNGASIPSNPNWSILTFSAVVTAATGTVTFVAFPTGIQSLVPNVYTYPQINVGSDNEIIVVQTPLGGSSWAYNGFYVNLMTPGGSYVGGGGSYRLDVTFMGC